MQDSYRLFFKAFSNKTRQEIIKVLKNQKLSVSEICQKTGFEQSRVSHNLKCLENCAFVRYEKKGSYRFYYLDKDIKKIINLIEKHIKNYESKIKSCEVVKNE